MIKLRSLNITKDNFEKIVGLNYNIKEVSAYYFIHKERADRLTLEGEYVGITYNNLVYLQNIINNSKNKEYVKK